VIAGWGAHAYTYFNLNRNMKVIRGVQLEADIKIFPKVIPILKTTPNQSWFLTVGVSYVQGRKW
jgi:hypothetical protein